jgi:hypothetical protein
VELHDLMSSLQKAADLDLLRLRTAIDHLLQQPARIIAIRQHLHLGQEVNYLNMRENQLQHGRILEFKPDQVLVQSDDSSKYGWIPYAAIRIDAASMPRAEPPTRLDRHAVAVGDTVSFEGRDLIAHFGTIERLNQKTATVSCDGQPWRVSYALLRPVIDL